MKTFLKSIQIEGFKSIRSSTLELRPLNVLIGANGAGKSNFISFFKMLRAINLGEFGYWLQQSAGGARSILHLNPKVTDTISAELKYQTEQGLMTFSFKIKHTSANDGFVFISEQYFKSKDELSKPDNFFLASSGFHEVPLGGMSRNSELKKLFPHEDGAKIQGLMQQLLSRTIAYQFHDTSENAYMKLTGTLDDDVFLRSDAGNLAAVLYKLKNHHPKHYKHILKTIQLTAPFFKDFVLEPNGHSIRLRYSEFGSDIVYGAHQISDGTLRFMALMTLLLQPLEQMPSVILIDEPELGLHPHALEVLLSIMRRVSKNRQIIVSTQSVSLVDRLEPEEVIVVERQNNESQFKRLDPQSLETWLEDYSLGELWEKNVFGGRPSR